MHFKIKERIMEGSKSRHGCLTVWLVIIIIGSSLSALMYLFGSEIIRRTFPDTPGWTFIILIVLSLFNIVCAIALLQWKKWGFWGICASSIAAIIINIVIGLGIGYILSGLIGVVLLYAVLQIGKENKGWPQLD
jgi:hypothetical protein